MAKISPLGVVQWKICSLPNAVCCMATSSHIPHPAAAPKAQLGAGQRTARKSQDQWCHFHATRSYFIPETRRSSCKEPAHQILTRFAGLQPGSRLCSAPLSVIPSPTSRGEPSPASKALILRLSTFPHSCVLTVLKPLINCN